MESHLYYITVVYTEMVTGLEKCIKLIVVLLNIILRSNFNTCSKKENKVFILINDHTLDAGLVLHFLCRAVGSYSRKW